MQQTLAILGAVAILAAILGGGMSAAGATVPVIKSVRRQVLLAVAGVALLVLAFTLADDSDSNGDNGSSTGGTDVAASSTTSPPAEQSTTTETAGSEESSSSTVQTTTTTTLPPISVVADVIVEDLANPDFMFLSDDFDRAGSPPSRCDDWPPWVKINNGAASSGTRVQLVVEGQRTAEVVITDVRIEILEQKPAIHGLLVRCFRGSTGSVKDVRRFEVDLEAGGTVTYLERDDTDALVKAEMPRFGVSQNDSEIFELLVFSGECSCTWIAKLQVVIDGQSMEIVVDNGGEPFRNSGWQNYVQRETWDAPSGSWADN